MNIKKIFFLLALLGVFNVGLKAQRKWPVPLYLPEYGVYLNLTNDISLNDTAIITYSQNIYFKIVLFEGNGKSYFEVYKNDKLYEKGYYENSLDTLKKYSSAVKVNGSSGPIRIFSYFQPLKNGEWIETKNGKLVKKIYNMGVLD